jgi:isoleucyl-tRNA synthetase
LTCSRTACTPARRTACERRSAQTALHQITQAMLRWMAPFLSFTAEEAWTVFAKDEKSQGSIFFETYSSLPLAQ